MQNQKKKNKHTLAPLLPGLAWHSASSKPGTGITDPITYTAKTTEPVTFIHTSSHLYRPPIWRASWKEIQEGMFQQKSAAIFDMSHFSLCKPGVRISVSFATYTDSC